MEKTLDEKIEELAQEWAAKGVQIERMREILRRAIYAPPTKEEEEETQ
jgi:hypothetical protein